MSNAAALLDMVLSAGQTVVLTLDRRLHVVATGNPALLEEWCEDSHPPEAQMPLRDLLARLLPAAATRALQKEIAGAASDPELASRDFGILTLRTQRGAAPDRHVELSLHGLSATQLLLILREVSALGEMQQSLTAAQASLDTAMAALRAPPEALRLFLGASMASIGAIRATLRTPARSREALQGKLERLRIDVARLETEAQAIELTPVLHACSALSGRLVELLRQDDISGDAMLPLAVLVDRIATAVGTAWRIEEQRHVPPAAAEAGHTESQVTRRRADWVKLSERRWNGFLRRRGEELGTLVRFSMEGAQQVPASLRRSVDDMLQHLLRNAVEHGIETPEERLAIDKPVAGLVSVRFEDQGRAGVRMTVRDDGRGFDVERIGRAAVRCGLVTEESLLEHEAVDVVGLIFRPEFTTEGLDGEEGRGRGMSFLRKAVSRLGGQISVATKHGHYTQFIVQLPVGVAVPAEADAAAPQAAST